MSREYHILNLGAGVQSTRLYMMAMAGEIRPFDYAIFADTQDEPGGEERRHGEADPVDSVYAHLEWLGSQASYLDSKSPLVRSSHAQGAGCPILVRTAGHISRDLLRGENSTGQHFASIPAFTSAVEGGVRGQTRRQCTYEYKVMVIEKAIRYEILGLRPGDRLPKDVIVHQYIGISWDERSRAVDIARRFEVAEYEGQVQQNLFGEDTIIDVETGRRQKSNWRVHFPLIEESRRITRDDCERENARTIPHRVYGSACIQCPYQDDPTWARRMEPGLTRERVIQIDHGIRTPGVIVNRGLQQKLYLHASCRPIDQINFKNEKQLGFAMECEGGCGL